MDKMQQAMRDSRLFTVCQGQSIEDMLMRMQEGVESGLLEVGWHKSPAYVLVTLMCRRCEWLAGAEIYTKEQINTGVTQEHYRKVQEMLALMLGVKIGPHQGV